MEFSASFLRFYRWLTWAVLGLIVLGASVRIMNAGVACPDWPLCFGQLVPDFHPQVYFEFIHRVWAGLVAVAIGASHFMLLRRPKLPPGVRLLAALSYVILFVQIIVGGLTVLWNLHAKVVTLHLALGTGLFLSVYWNYLALTSTDRGSPVWQALAAGRALGWRIGAWALFFLVYLQLLLGGLVASNYAAQACPDFPLCLGQWVPTLRGTIGLQVLHRFGAYAVALGLVLIAIMAKYHRAPDLVRRGYNWAIPVLLMQMTLGVLNVFYGAPPLLAVGHFIGGVVLASLALRQAFFMEQVLARSAVSVHPAVGQGARVGRPVTPGSFSQQRL